MTLGPISYMVVTFEGNKFKGEILDTLVDGVQKGLIRVVDILFARKDADGTITVAELNEVKNELKASDKVLNDLVELLSEADLVEIAKALPNNTAAGVLVLEHRWAIPLGNAIADAGGTIVESGMIKREVVEAAEVYYEQSLTSGN